MHFHELKADLAGLVVLAILTTIVALVMMDAQRPIGMWPFIYAGWAALAEFAWRHPLAPRTPRSWWLCTICSIFAAAAWIGISRLARKVFFGLEEPGLSLTFDLVLLMILSPGLTFVAVAGAVRSLILARTANRKL